MSKDELTAIEKKEPVVVIDDVMVKLMKLHCMLTVIGSSKVNDSKIDKYNVDGSVLSYAVHAGIDILDDAYNDLDHLSMSMGMNK